MSFLGCHRLTGRRSNGRRQGTGRFHGRVRGRFRTEILALEISGHVMIFLRAMFHACLPPQTCRTESQSQTASSVALAFCESVPGCVVRSKNVQIQPSPDQVHTPNSSPVHPQNPQSNLPQIPSCNPHLNLPISIFLRLPLCILQ